MHLWVASLEHGDLSEPVPLQLISFNLKARCGHGYVAADSITGTLRPSSLERHPHPFPSVPCHCCGTGCYEAHSITIILNGFLQQDSSGLWQIIFIKSECVFSHDHHQLVRELVQSPMSRTRATHSNGKHDIRSTRRVTCHYKTKNKNLRKISFEINNKTYSISISIS